MTKVICNECETVAHCSKYGCIPKQPAPVAKPPEQEPVAWQTVPTDPSIAACITGSMAVGGAIDGKQAALVYAAMLNAAPQPAQQEQGELRRLHEANQAMLEALKAILEDIDSDHGTGYEYAKARAAFAKGEKI